MDNMLLMRLNLLLDAGEIDEEIIQIIAEFTRMVEEELSLSIDEKNGSMFITHMAMALSRIKKGEEIMPMDESLLDEVKASNAYNKIPTLIDEIEKRFDINIPKSEFGYIALHLCNLENINS